ncbi:hypothetical protein DS745_17755 [Anaerobacillus alkaliphilus]|uniref:Uncharacterized protein n=1 Tax=Anaerobacillus alkaliphilus TaxID=1548597 RepID=A0A4Q0VQF2_9BACI|nr:hypothetical protein [Anaerobacillus alkaliphilus]RXI98185.1 hypothetical protein DS745_17755 [Anaerobacillus alkaliphilus]
MNFFMFLAPVLLIVGLFGLYDKIRLCKKNGVFPYDFRLYRWFALLLFLIVPVRLFQEEFRFVKVGFYILIPVVLIWLFYVHFRDGKAYKVIDISEKEFLTKVEQIVKEHKVKMQKGQPASSEYPFIYKLGNTEASILIDRTKGRLNETHEFSYVLTFKKWWKLPNSEVIIEDLIKRLQHEREPLKLQKHKVIGVVYAMILFIGLYLALNTF